MGQLEPWLPSSTNDRIRREWSLANDDLGVVISPMADIERGREDCALAILVFGAHC